ncbi:MAG: hypothetical protein JW765_05390 [Deltaproteobacteria bacterium]|nr:hypothetical protein [Candidatus Zymogenaceae bacterium]
MRKNRSLNILFVGAGQGGSRQAAEFGNLYDYVSLSMNTAEVDELHSQIGLRRRLHLDTGIDGAGKNLQLGESAVKKNRKKIIDFLKLYVTPEIDYIIVCVGGGGGTGSGGLIPLIEILKDFGKPIGVIYTLPLKSEDTITHRNCLFILKKVFEDNEVSPLVIVDNAKIALKYPNLSAMDRWSHVNQYIARGFHIFNMLTSYASEIHSLDMADYEMILRAGGCMALGEAVVPRITEPEILAEKMRDSISSGLLADGFDLATTKRAGIILRGSTKALRSIKAADMDYALDHIREIVRGGTVYRGIYPTDSRDDELFIYSMFGGLDLPMKRIQTMMESTKEGLESLQKKKSRDVVFDLETNLDSSIADEGIDPLLKFIRDKISGEEDEF